jgi:hypothetical protein
MVELESELNHTFKLYMDMGQSAGVDLIKDKLSKLSEKKSDFKRQINETDWMTRISSKEISDLLGGAAWTTVVPNSKRPKINWYINIMPFVNSI